MVCRWEREIGTGRKDQDPAAGCGYMVGKREWRKSKDGSVIELSDGIRDGQKVARRGRGRYDTMIRIHMFEKSAPTASFIDGCER